MGIAPAYDARLFVTPGEAYRRVLAKVQRWREAQPKKPFKQKIWRARHRSAQAAPGDQVLSLVGERGSGKTWLLRHLAEDDNRVSPLSLYLDLERRTRHAKPENFCQAVEEQIRAQCSNSRAVLLLDAVPPYLDDHLRALENEILKPELTQRGSLVIMAPVHPLQICWRLPALRGAERCSLAPFDESLTREQLWQLQQAGIAQNGLKASLVHAASGGLPLFTYLVATRDEVDSSEALLTYWLARVPATERERVRSYLEAVCTLDTLEHAKIRKALAAYHRYYPDMGKYPSHPGDVRNALRKHWLAHSMPTSPGRLVVVDSIGRATRQIVQARNADLYASLKAIA